MTAAISSSLALEYRSFVSPGSCRAKRVETALKYKALDVISELHDRALSV